MPVKSERMGWLKTLCSDCRPQIDRPFGATHEGVRYIGATEGHAMVLLRALDDEKAPPFDGAQTVLAGLSDALWLPELFEDVVRWAMAYDRRCDACGGIGFYPEPDLAAFDSDGGGPVTNLWKKCPCQNIGVRAGVKVNRRLVLEYLSGLDTGEVAVAGIGGKMLALRSPDWLVVVMGVSDDPAPSLERQSPSPAPQVLGKEGESSQPAGKGER